jgi:exoribonuclease II
VNKKEQIREEIRPGLIIEYLQNNQPVPAWIMEVQGTRVRVLNINQREVKLAVSRILPWMGPGYAQGLSREDIIGLLKEHNSKRLEEQENIDLMEVWEMSQGEIDQAPVSWFAGLIRNEPDYDQTAALGRVMLQDKARFKFSPPLFEIYTEDVVDQRLEQERVTREKEKLISIGRDLFKSLWELGTKTSSLPEVEDQEVSDKLRDLIITRIKNPDDSETQDVWTRLTTGLPQDQNLAFILGKKWGIYSPHHNFLLDQADYAWDDDWTSKHQEQISAIKEVFGAQVRDPELKGFVSIDSETTKDIDDAFTIDTSGECFSLTLALACPAMVWEPGSDLDRAVAHRTTSLYLPEGVSNMLPGFMAEDLFSLVQEKPRPAMVLKIEIDENARVRQLDISRTWVMVDANLSYEFVEKRLGEGLRENLDKAYRLALLLRQKRLKAGAVIIQQDDPEIKLTESNGETRVSIVDKPECPRAQLTVSEFMILANSALAGWAQDREIPLFYRTQDIALPRDYCGVWSKPQDIYQVIRSLGATLTETSPKPHRSIGAPCYAPFTSPLRRYTDLINELQILGFIENESPPLNKEQMDEMLPDLNSRTSLVSQVQRFRPRYWKLVYLKQNCKNTTWRGIVVDNNGHFVILSLPKELMMVRASHQLFGGKTRLGQAFRLRLGKIDPLNNEVSVLEAWEE